VRADLLDASLIPSGCRRRDEQFAVAEKALGCAFGVLHRHCRDELIAFVEIFDAKTSVCKCRSWFAILVDVSKRSA